MAFTDSDISQVERAIVALATGSRLAVLNLSNGTRYEFTPSTVEQLMKLRSQMYAEREVSTAQCGFVLGATSKGF